LLLLVELAGILGCHRTPQVALPAQTYHEAQSQFEQGDLIGAFRKSDAAYQEFSRGNPEWAWRFRALAAEILVWRGLSSDALELVRPQLPPELLASDVAVRREIVLGLCDSALQRRDEAVEHVDIAEQLATSHQPDLLGEVYLSRGNLAIARNDYSAAEPAFRQALQFSYEKKQSFLRLKALGSLGFISMQKGHYDESIDWDTQALELSRSLSARIAGEKVEGNLAWNYYTMGDLENALTLSVEAKNVATQLGADKDEMLWLRNIGTIEFTQRSYTAAARDYAEGLRLARKLENKSLVAECLNNLAHVELKEGNYNQADTYNREALTLEREAGDRPLELYSLITEGYISSSKNDFKKAESDLEAVRRESGSDQYLHWQVEAASAEVFAAANQPAIADEHYKASLLAIEAARSSIKHENLRLTSLSGVIEYYESYVSFLISRHATERALEVAELSRARTLANGLGVRNASVSVPIKGFNPARTAKSLSTTILCYWLGVEHSYLWVITSERVKLFTLPPAAEIDPLVQSYRQALLGSRDVLETQNAAGQKLYDLLVAPATQMIPQGTRVTILPDGSLYGLNFETLLAPLPQLHYWIEDVDVSYANSLTLLAAGVSRRPALARKLLLVGDPVSPDAEFPKLPQAAAEMTGIENYFPAAERTVFSGAEATPDSYLKSQPAGFSYIHFVAHGTASRTSPLDSAVILSRQGDDYKLYARDIIQHPLHADLVTISACHGEGVRTYSGEGLVGLSWAFLHAGAHGVIAALWEVNDNSTPQLMDQLYSEIGKGAAPDAALRDAKLALLHSGGVYRRPFYWAPFELYRGS
jgi:CHAT domain-containing protein/tetratricopeptide (TPR) repeat protein